MFDFQVIENPGYDVDVILLNEGGDGTVYVVSSWAADWAVDAPKKFEKPEEKKEKDDGAKK